MNIKTNPLINVFTFPMVTGSFPFRCSAEGVKLRNDLILYGVFLRVLLGIECLHEIYNLQNTTENKRFNFISIVMSYFFLYSFTVVSFIFLFLRKNCFISVLKNCKIVDEELFQLGVQIQFSDYRFAFDVIIVSVALIPPTIQIFMTNSAGLQFITKIISSLYLTISVYTTVYPFIRVLGIIRIRFIALKNMFLSLRASESALVQHVRLVNMAQLHCLLCRSCRLLNKSFSPQLLLLFFIIFGNSVTSSYNVIDGWQSKEEGAVIFIKGIIIIFYGSIAFLVTYLCKCTSHVASEFNDKLYQLMTSDESGNICTDKKLRLHVSMKREVNFTACGFFNIDYTLIHTMIAAATTYLVLLIQYGEPDVDQANPVTMFSNVTASLSPSSTSTLV